MLDLRPSCECCGRALPNEALAAICTFECTFCTGCALGHLDGLCPNCGGDFVLRPLRPPGPLARHPASAVRVEGPPGTCPEPWPDTPAMATTRLLLRAFAPEDVPAMLAYRNDPEIARYQSWTGMTANAGATFARVQATRRLGEPGGWTQLSIALLGTGEVIGDCALHVEADDRRQARLGYTVAAAHQGRGYAREAVGALVEHCFNVLGLHRIVASTDPRNAASIALLHHLGFTCEARHRQAVYLKGAYVDDWVFAKLAPA